MNKKAFYFNESTYLREANSVLVTIDRLNRFLTELKSHEITIDQVVLLSLINNVDGIDIKKLQVIVDLHTVGKNPQIAALHLSAERVRFLIDFESVAGWNLEITNGTWLLQNPGSFAIDNMTATLSKGWETTLKNQFTQFAETPDQLARLELILQIRPLIEKFAELAEIQPFDYDFSLFEREFDNSVHIRPEAVFNGCNVQPEYYFAPQTEVRPLYVKPVPKDYFKGM